MAAALIAAAAACAPQQIFINYIDSPSRMRVSWATTCKATGTVSFGTTKKLVSLFWGCVFLGRCKTPISNASLTPLPPPFARAKIAPLLTSPPLAPLTLGHHHARNPALGNLQYGLLHLALPLPR